MLAVRGFKSLDLRSYKFVKTLCKHYWQLCENTNKNLCVFTKLPKLPNVVTIHSEKPTWPAEPILLTSSFLIRGAANDAGRAG